MPVLSPGLCLGQSHTQKCKQGVGGAGGEERGGRFKSRGRGGAPRIQGHFLPYKSPREGVVPEHGRGRGMKAAPSDRWSAPLPSHPPSGTSPTTHPAPGLLLAPHSPDTRGGTAVVSPSEGPSGGAASGKPQRPRASTHFLQGAPARRATGHQPVAFPGGTQTAWHEKRPLPAQL